MVEIGLKFFYITELELFRSISVKCIWDIPVPISNLFRFIDENLEYHHNVSLFRSLLVF